MGAGVRTMALLIREQNTYTTPSRHLIQWEQQIPPRHTNIPYAAVGLVVLLELIFQGGCSLNAASARKSARCSMELHARTLHSMGS